MSLTFTILLEYTLQSSVPVLTQPAFCFVDVKRKQKLGFKDQNIIMFCFIWIPINKLLRSVVLLFITLILIDKIDPKSIKNHYNKKNFKGTYSENRKDIQPLTLQGITRY